MPAALLANNDSHAALTLAGDLLRSIHGRHRHQCGGCADPGGQSGPVIMVDIARPINCPTRLLRLPNALLPPRGLCPMRSAMTQHDFCLIIDFGSQVTQLIARRLREWNVYCEIHPFNTVDDAFLAARAQGDHPVGRAGVGARAGQPARPASGVRDGRARLRHLLRPAGDDGSNWAGRSNPATMPNSGAPISNRRRVTRTTRSSRACSTRAASRSG